MALPKLIVPTFTAVIPSTKEPIKFRPFLVKEEKLLLMALEGNDPTEIEEAITNILSECIITPGFDVRKLASYDVEYLFIMLRAKSVGEFVDLNLRHGSESKCTHITKHSLDLTKIKTKFNPEHTNIIHITEELGLKMRDPSLHDIAKNMDQTQDELDNIISIIASCVEHVFDIDTVYEEFSHKEMVELLSNMTQKQFTNVQKFFETIPVMTHTIDWTCEECMKTDTIVLEGLQSFFM